MVIKRSDRGEFCAALTRSSAGRLDQPGRETRQTPPEQRAIAVLTPFTRPETEARLPTGAEHPPAEPDRLAQRHAQARTISGTINKARPAPGVPPAKPPNSPRPPIRPANRGRAILALAEGLLGRVDRQGQQAIHQTPCKGQQVPATQQAAPKPAEDQARWPHAEVRRRRQERSGKPAGPQVGDVPQGGGNDRQGAGEPRPWWGLGPAQQKDLGRTTQAAADAQQARRRPPPAGPSGMQGRKLQTA